MIATMEQFSILDEADTLASMLIHSDVFIKYLDSRERVAQDEEAQDLVRRFVKVKDKYDEVQRFGRYHPDYKSVITQMMEAKRDADMNDLISAYKEAENELQQLLNEISLVFARSVSESIKVPTGDPFFDRSCGGGCGTGGACQCH